MNRIIVDSNIIFSSLLKRNHPFSDLLCTSDNYFYSVNFAFIEIFKYKEKIIKYSQLTDNEVLDALHRVTKNINFFRHDAISNDSWRHAHQLCHDIDIKDIPFVALTIEIDGRLWTGDKKLVEGLSEKNFTHFFTP